MCRRRPAPHRRRIGRETAHPGDEGAGAVDRFGLFERQMAKTPVGARRRLLDQRQSAHEFGKMPDGHAGDREILDRAQGMDSPVSVGRNVGLAEEVVLAPRRDTIEVNLAGHAQRARSC